MLNGSSMHDVVSNVVPQPWGTEFVNYKIRFITFYFGFSSTTDGKCFLLKKLLNSTSELKPNRATIEPAKWSENQSLFIVFVLVLSSDAGTRH